MKQSLLQVRIKEAVGIPQVNIGLTDSDFRASIQISTIGDDVVVTWTDATDTSDASNDSIYISQFSSK